MFEGRLASLCDLQVAHAIDCVALLPGANLQYFSGLRGHLSERPTVLFVPVQGAPAVVLPVLEAPSARAHLPEGVRLFTYSDEEGHEHAFHQVSAELQLTGKAIGIEYLGMRTLEMRRIEEAAPDCRLLATEPWLPALRAVKDAAELADIRRAIEIAEQAMKDLLGDGAIRPGKTELEVAADIQIAMLRQGGQGLAFSPIVVAGPNSASPHAGPSDRPMQAGDLVTVDWGSVYNGYRSDVTRTFVLGEPTAEIERIYDAVLAANQSGRLAARAEMPAQDVDRAARRAISAAGYGEYFIHRTGHGLGLEGHEPPYIVEGNLEMLLPGNVVTIEPGVYIPGLGGVRIEDDVLIVEGGSDTLTSLARELVSL